MRNCFIAAISVIIYITYPFTASASTSSSVVLLGDSIFSGFTNYIDLLPSNTIDLAVGGSQVNDLTSTVSTALSDNPNEIFIMIGINDVNVTSVSDFSSIYSRQISNIVSNNKNVKIYLESILPVNFKDFIATKGLNNDLIPAYNTAIQQIASSYSSNVTYLDFTSSFSDSFGNLNKSLSVDGIHLNQSGYQLLASLMAQYE
jgi:lysophospholipase L1-like esterase